MMPSLSRIDTTFGAFEIYWKAPNIICGTILPGAVIDRAVLVPLPPWLRKVEAAISGYFLGEEADFHQVCGYFGDDTVLPVLDSISLTPFRRAVYEHVARIGYGTSQTYGQVAQQLQAGKAARAVGGAMRSNPFPLLVPCHRILASDGLGGFSGGDGLELKRRMLVLEGLRSG